MIVTVVFDPDPALPPDPSDDASPPDPMRQGLVFDSKKDDLLVIFRQYGEQYSGGQRTNVIGTGIWLNIGLGQIGEMIERLNE